MERAPSNSTENDSDEEPRVNRCKRKRTTRYRRKSTPSNHNNKRAAGTRGDLLEAPPRAIGVDGHFYECIKCNEVGSLICCDTCACTYHLKCLDPPLESAPDGDWFCQNCCEEEENLSDSAENVATTSSKKVRRRRRTPKRACKVTSGCRLCLKIRKKLVPDKNSSFSFKTKSTALQSKSPEHGQPTHNDGGEAGKRLVIRPRQKQVSRIKTGRGGRRRASSSSAHQAAETGQNVNVQLPKRRGRPPGKNRTEQVQQQQPEQEQQQNQRRPEDLSMVIYGANLLPPEYIAAIISAEEARRNNEETPWAGVELDALWVGIRRHGVDNWDTIVEDPTLAILMLCKKTSQDLALRWHKEGQKMHSILISSGHFAPPLPLPNNNVQQHQPAGAIISNNLEGEVERHHDDDEQVSMNQKIEVPINEEHASANAWRPNLNLNLNPSDNHDDLFEAFQRRANNNTSSRSLIDPFAPSSSSGPPLAMPPHTSPTNATATTSANTTDDDPRYLFGGLFPVRPDRRY